MNDEDKKLLELYLKETKKKKMIISIIIVFFFLFCIIAIDKYYIKHKSISNNFSDSIIENYQIFLNEIVENNVVNNTNSEIISENIIEYKIENNHNSVETKTQKKSLQEGKTKEEEKPQQSQNTISQASNNKVKVTSIKPQDKDFLFTDGYSMDNVTKVAQEYLKSSGYSGECIPLEDAEGVYYGMRVIFY